MSLVRRLYGAWAVLMLCTYLSIFIVQCVHTHAAPSLAKQETAKFFVQEIAPHCDICDFFLHKQGKYLFPETPSAIVVYKAAIIQNERPYHANIPKLSFFSWMEMAGEGGDRGEQAAFFCAEPRYLAPAGARSGADREY